MKKRQLFFNFLPNFCIQIFSKNKLNVENLSIWFESLVYILSRNKLRLWQRYFFTPLFYQRNQGGGSSQGFQAKFKPFLELNIYIIFSLNGN